MNTNKFCDCSQGRFPCSCKQAALRLSRPPTITMGPVNDQLTRSAMLGLSPEEPQNFFRDLSARQGKELADNWVELNALKWKIQISQGLALLGWAAAILLALGV